MSAAVLTSELPAASVVIYVLSLCVFQCIYIYTYISDWLLYKDNFMTC